MKQAKRKDYYKLLGVERSAGESEIKRAYYKAAKLWHPGEHCLHIQHTAYGVWLSFRSL